jgi:hypothetical protein
MTTVRTRNSLRRSSRRLNQLNRGVAVVLDAMRNGATLHLEFFEQGPRWRMSTGHYVTDAVARIVIINKRVAGVGDTVKHDVLLLGHLANGLGYYRFSYNGSNRVYVGVISQEVQTVMPKAVVRDRDGTLRVLYDRLGIKFQSYEQWITSGARLPAAVPASH